MTQIKGLEALQRKLKTLENFQRKLKQPMEEIEKQRDKLIIDIEAVRQDAKTPEIAPRLPKLDCRC